MSVDLEQRLREAFDADAERARLENPDGLRALEARPLTEETGTGRTARRATRVLAAAAVAALVALVGAVTVLDDDQGIETIQSALPQSAVRSVPGVGQVISGSGCPFAIGGNPVDVQPGPLTGRFLTLGGQGVAHVRSGAQVAEIHVPGMPVHAGLSGNEEPIELGRGQATAWDGPVSTSRPGAGELPFVQVRFPGSDAPCSSFTVTVDGGSPADNRALAVDLADRLLLPAELEELDLPGAEGGPIAGLELQGTEWSVATGVGDPRMSFTDKTIAWEDRCGHVLATYEVDRDEGTLVIVDRAERERSCPAPLGSDVAAGWMRIEEVMRADRIPMNLIEGRLFLGDLEDDRFLALTAPASSSEDALPSLPGAGLQPTDQISAEEQVRAAFVGLFDASVPREDRAQFVDRPEVWLPLNQELFESEYGVILKDLHAVVDSVVFTSPSHASVRFQLLASDERVPGDYVVGDALLVDGRWVVDVTTPCFTAEATGHRCDFTP